MPFQLPAADEKERFIRDQFNCLARRYDLTNDIISFGMHRLWKRAAVDALSVRPEGSYLDLCCGSGDLTLSIAARLNAQGMATGVDFSANMLAVAQGREITERKKKRIAAPLVWLSADVLQLPFPDNSFDGAVISFGLRNLTDLKRGIYEMVRVVKPGGRVVNLDVGKVKIPLYSSVYKLYFHHVVPIIGALVQGNRQAYTYLPESARNFPAAPEIACLMAEAGLSDIVIKQAAGGAAAMQFGTKR